MSNPRHNNNLCPLCGSQCSYVQVQGLTISACSSCCQASILETNIIIRVSPDKLLGQAFVQRDLLMVALTMQMLYKNWNTVADVPMGE